MTPSTSESDLTEAASAREVIRYEPSKVPWATVQYLESAPAWFPRFLIIAPAMILLIAAVFAGATQFAISVEARGTLISESLVLPIRIPSNLKVAKLLVSEDKVVKQGDLLLSGEDQLGEADYLELKADASKFQSLAHAKNSLHCDAECRSELRSLTENAFKHYGSAQLRELLLPIRELAKDWMNAIGEYENLPAINRGLENRIKLDQGKLAEIKRRGALRILAIQVEQLNSEILTDQSEIARRTQEAETRLKSVRDHLDNQLSDLMRVIDRYRNMQSVVAPVSGTVTNLKVGGVGQLLTEGQEVMTIMPADSVFLAELSVANHDITRIRPGMPVKIRLDALPEREFQSIEGTVKDVPPAVSGASGESDYKVRVTLSQQSVQKNGIRYPFRLGMNLTGYVVVDHRSLLSIAIQRTFQLGDDLFRR